MTQGTATYSSPTPVNDRSGPTTIGLTKIKTWSGTDSPNPRVALVENQYFMSYGETYDELVTLDPRYYGTGEISTARIIVNWPRCYWDSNHNIKMWGRLQERVDGHDFNGGVFLAELGQTASMIGSAATTIAQAIKDFKRGNMAGVTRGYTRSKSQARRASDAWSEMAYGWTPLLSDVKSGAEALASFNRPEKHVFRVSDKKVVSQTVTDNNFGRPHIMYQEIQERWKVITTEGRPALSSLQLQDPVGVAWELVPYSFVFDWFVPIGDWLQAIIFSRNFSTSLTVITSTARKSRVSTMDGSYQKSFQLSRTPMASPPLQLPALKDPELPSVRRCLNAIALIGQRVAD